MIIVCIRHTASDHSTILVELDFSGPEPTFHQVRYFLDNAIGSFRSNIDLEEWYHIYGILDIDVAFNKFAEISSYVNLNVPLILEIKNTKNRKTWGNVAI